MMKSLIRFSVMVLIFQSITARVEGTIRIVPEPSVVEWNKGTFITRAKEGAERWLSSNKGESS